ncbi:MAG: hypothetical protein J7L98_02835 [Candidatus Verstraetearchaeota archaeon]|nr:hypothetical protein [Candidatus Verstraetearchaeota archaeon]
MKAEIRVCFVELLEKDGREILVAVVTRGGRWVDGVLCKYISKPSEAADAIAESKYFEELRVLIAPQKHVEFFQRLEGVEIYSRDDFPRELTPAVKLGELITNRIAEYLARKNLIP